MLFWKTKSGGGKNISEADLGKGQRHCYKRSFKRAKKQSERDWLKSHRTVGVEACTLFLAAMFFGHSYPDLGLFVHTLVFLPVLPKPGVPPEWPTPVLP